MHDTELPEINTPEEAFRMALVLAVTAPDKGRLDQAVKLAEIIAIKFNLSESTIFDIQTDIEAQVLAGEELL